MYVRSVAYAETPTAHACVAYDQPELRCMLLGLLVCYRPLADAIRGFGFGSYLAAKIISGFDNCPVVL